MMHHEKFRKMVLVAIILVSIKFIFDGHWLNRIKTIIINVYIAYSAVYVSRWQQHQESIGVWRVV